MPRRDGTGPMGRGAMTGRGLGFCTGVNAVGYGAGLGRGYGAGLGRGYGRGMGCGMGLGYGSRRGLGGYFAGQFSGLTDKEIFAEEKELLQKRLDAISMQLDKLSENESNRG